MAQSSIERTEVTWNPVTWCTQISEWCKNCYALRMSKRLQAMWLEKYKDGFKLRIHPEALDFPSKLKKPSMIFVNSMSDLFHKDVPTSFIFDVFSVMNREKKHIFQVLTKRPERVLELNKQLKRTRNIWMWTSVENQKVSDRINLLSKTSAKIKFISAEPLLWDLCNLNLKKIDRLIVWWESWPKARPMMLKRVENIKNQCRKHSTAFFFKQWWWVNKKNTGRVLNGEIYNEYPAWYSPC